jgi:hypothetical protein
MDTKSLLVLICCRGWISVFICLDFGNLRQERIFCLEQRSCLQLQAKVICELRTCPGPPARLGAESDEFVISLNIVHCHTCCAVQLSDGITFAGQAFMDESSAFLEVGYGKGQFRDVV